MPDQGGPERLPPHSRDAERGVLGSMLRDNGVIGDVLQITRTENFYTDAHQKIAQAVFDLYDKGHPVDAITLADLLKERKQIEDIGGYGYLGELWDAAPSAANAEYYARIVRDKAVVRYLIHAGTEILRDAYNAAQPADELLEGAERKILDIAQMGITGQTVTLKDALKQVYDRIDSRATGEQNAISGIATGFIDLDDKTAGLQNSELVILAARPSVGKCLAADSEIVLDDGSVVTIEDVYRRQGGRLLTLCPDWRFGWTEPSAFVDDGIKPVYRVTTQLGRRIETTLAHPFLTIHGWRPLGELSPGERIAVPRRIDCFGQEAMRECEIKLLGYLIGDGGLTDKATDFTNADPRLRADFSEAVAAFGGVQVRLEDSHGTRTPSLHIASDRQLLTSRRQAFGRRLSELLQAKAKPARWLAGAVGVSPVLVHLWARGRCAPEEEAFGRLCAALAAPPEALAPHGPAAIRKNAKNAVTRWLEELGLWGKGSRDKFIPAPIFRLPRSQLAQFLNRLFATDGWATLTTGGNTQLGFATVSERLARQVQHLLLRFGIIGRLRERRVKYRDTRRQAWQLDVTDPDAIRTFVAEVGMFGKEAALTRVMDMLATRKGYKTNCDLIPVEVWENLAKAKREESWCSLARRAGLPNHTNIHVGRRALSRPRLERFATALAAGPLLQLARSDLYWDEIVALEPIGPKQVYDLTIPETHNFVANDVCVHNTALALNIARHVAVEEKQPVFFVSLEQSRLELTERLLCCQGRVDSHKLRKSHISGEEMQRLIEAGEVLRKATFFIDDSPGQGMLRIAANARRLKLRHGIRLLIIDYLQLIEPDNRRDSRQEQVSQISRRLKFLAKELDLPVIALAQLNRGVEDRQDHKPRLSDLRESGSLEQDADTVLLIHRPEYYEPGQHEGTVEIIIAKQRNGPVGEITLTYVKQFMRYENFEMGHPFDG